jgi:hypothetical protein
VGPTTSFVAKWSVDSLVSKFQVVIPLAFCHDKRKNPDSKFLWTNHICRVVWARNNWSNASLGINCSNQNCPLRRHVGTGYRMEPTTETSQVPGWAIGPLAIILFGLALATFKWNKANKELCGWTEDLLDQGIVHSCTSTDLCNSYNLFLHATSI